MRTCIGISVAIHIVVMLWLVLAPGAKTFGPANAEAILVDLVPPQDTRAAEREPPGSEAGKSEDAKSEEKTELSRAAARKPEVLSQEPLKPEPLKPRPDSAEERAATAARLAWMLNLPMETEA